ncbi:MAG: class B sortase [Clostridiales bacterium]|nr:class B sortase [Clostridiales bacterium]
MAENDSKKDMNTADWDDDFDAVSEDLKALTAKYGLSSELPTEKKKPKNTPTQTAAPPVYSNHRAVTPKNNTPARTPGVRYTSNGGVPSISLVYDDNAPKGPEGRRVIYAEAEGETIAEKRRRNAAARQKTEKGSVGFGSQPYVKHVASSESAIKKDDPTVFTRAYAVTRHSGNEQNADSNGQKEETHTISQSESKLVAANPAKAESTVSEDSAAESRQHRHYETTTKDKFRNFFKSFIPWKGDLGKEIVRKIIMDLSAILVLVCFGYFINNYVEHQNQLKNRDSLKELASESTTDDDLEAQWAAIKAKYPDVDFPDGMNIKYAELYAQNQDLVGWLTISGTNIDTPIVHNPEDATNGADEDFYLHHNFYQNYDKYGNAYLDKYNTGLSLDKNNVIYGHNMTDGLSFAQLEKYYTIDGFAESPIIQYSTLFNDYYFKIYAVIITNGDISGDNGYLFNYTTVNFTSTESFTTFIEALDERKLYDTGVDINEDDTLITLSTCSYEIEDNGRLAVIGRMVRTGESTAVDTSLAVENTEIRYPQIWYDEHNMTNPYVDAYQWSQ